MAEFKLGRLRFVWKGTWTNGAVYVKDDIVKYGGTTYVCVTGHTANASFNVDIVASRWVVMTSGQEWKTNPWSISTVYKTNDLVKYGGNVYISTANHTSSATVAGGFYLDETAGRWDLFSTGSDWKGIWLPSTYYKENDLVKYNGFTYICQEAHTSALSAYSGESIDSITIIDSGSGYTNGADLIFSAPDLPGGTIAAGTVTVNGFGSVTAITISNNGIGYTQVPSITVDGAGAGASLLAALTSSFVNGLEVDGSKWNIFSEGFKWRGDWNGSQVPGSRVATAYAVNDIAKFGAGLYLCVTPHTSNATTFEESKWTTFVEGLEFEDNWSGSTEYQIGDIVTYGGYAYTAIARNTGQIPPTATGFWKLLTTGFNNRAEYISSQSYKVGDLIRYGGNTFVAVEEVVANETPYNTTSKWEKITDGFRWRNDWEASPAEPTYKLGDIVKYSASTYLVVAEHKPSDAATTTTATATTATTNIVTVADSSLLNLRQAVTFTGTGFGNLTNAVTYYVKEILGLTQIKISATQGGTVKTLTTATGTMTVTFSSRPDLDDGTFFNSFAEGDANNVLIRRGDIVTRNAIQNVRLVKGQTGTFLKAGEQDLIWSKVGNITRVFYVSTDGIDAPDRGTTLNDPWRTIKYACDHVRTVIVPTRAQPASINVKTGVYTEIFPISIPKFTSVIGDELRMSIVEPTPETSGLDKFYMRDSTTMRNFTFRGATGARLPNGTYDTYTAPNQYGTMRPTGGAWNSLDPGTGPNDESVWVGERSPYMQNITLFGDYCVGQKCDGSLHNGGNKSLTSNDYTTILSNGIGAWNTNQGRSELVSVFAYYSYIAYLCEAGGVIRATNGNNSYGTYGSVSEGVDPTEISRTSNVDNRRFQALVDRVQTDGADKILYLEYINAGEEYTTATYGFTGSGVGSSIVSTPVIRDGGIAEIQVLDNGENYTSVTNNAQAGTNIDIRLGAADIALSNSYNGQRILIVDGTGAGQYAYVTSFDGGSKLATIGMESFTPLEVSKVTTGTNRLTVPNTATLSVDMPFTLTGTAFGTLTTATQYYVKAIVGTSTLATVSISGNAGQFTCTSTTLLVDQTVTITGTAGGTGSITGYVTGKVYYIVATNGTTTFTLSESKGGQAIVTSLGTPTGLTYTLSGSLFTVYTNTSTKAEVTFATTNTGSMLLHKSGWDTVITDITESISAATQANPVAITTSVPHAYFTGMQVTITGVTGMTQLNGNTYFVVKTGASTFTLYSDFELTTTVDGTGYSTYVSGGTAVGTQYVPLFLNTTSRYVVEPRAIIQTGSGATATAVQTPGVNTISVVTGGGGFTIPPHVIVSGDGTATTGSGTIASSAISGEVDAVIIQGKGSGYVSAPTLTFVGGGLANGSINHATATATITNSIKTVNVTNGGSGYTSPPSVTATGTGGSGAILSAQISNVVGSVTLTGGTNSQGSGYTSIPTVAFSGGEPLIFAQGTAVLSAIVTTITVQEGGSGYAPFPATTVLLTSVTGSSATAQVVVDSGNYVAGVTPGVITSITVLTSGSGYATPPTVTIVGAGVDASATANIAGSVSSITITNPGRGYQTLPTVTISGGGGTGAQGTVVLTGSIFSLTVVDGGRGWVGTPTLSFNGGGGSSAAATVTAMDSVIDNITIVTAGTGYTSNPAISVNGGGFTSSAILRARINGILQTVTVSDPGGSYLATPVITFANGNNYKSVVAGDRYYRNASALVAIGLEQQTQTLAGIDRLRVVARGVAQNAAPALTYQTAIARTTGTAGPTGIENAVDVWANAVYYTIQNGETYPNAKALILANKQFLRKEVESFWTANYPGIADAVWSRDAGLLIDGIAEDLGARGVAYTLNAGINLIFAGTARTTNLATAVGGIEFIRDLVIDIVQNIIVTSLNGLTITASSSGLNEFTTSSTSTLAVGDIIRFTGTPIGGITANTTYYVYAVTGGSTFQIASTTDAITPLALISGSGSMTLTKQFVNDALTLESGALVAVPNLFNYAADIISTTVANSATFAITSSLLLSNKAFIKAEVIAYINTTFADFDYNQTLCARDVGFIIDAIAYDLRYAVDNQPSVTPALTGVVSGITVNTAGSGYGAGTTIAISGGGSPTVTAVATPILNSLTGAITGFTMTNKGRGYSTTPSVTVVPDAGHGAFVRAKIVGGAVNLITVIHPGSGYTASPNITLVDANNTVDGSFSIKIADGVLDQPRFTSRGTGFTTADALIEGDGYSDIAQVGQYVYVNNLTNIPTPGANVQFASDPSAFYKLVTVREVTGPSGIIGARQLIVDNKEFIQYEILSYLNNFTYNSVKCARDIGFIIDALADDFTYEGNARLQAVLYQHQRGTFALFEQQRMQTAFALEYLQGLINTLYSETLQTTFGVAKKLDFLIEWIKNAEYNTSLPALSMPNGLLDTQDDRAKNILLANELFITTQVVRWMIANSKIVGFTQATMAKEIRQMVRSVAYDLTYTGNSQTVEFATSYYIDDVLTIPGVPGTSAAAKANFLEVITYLGTVLSDVAVNNNVTPESGNTVVQNTSLTPGDTASQGRISTLSANLYAIVNSGFASSGVSLTASSFTGFTTTKRTSLLAQKATFTTNVTTWITDNFVNFTYGQDLCFRDTGLIVQAVADDIFGDVAKSVEAGQRYYAVTAALVLSAQKPQTIAAIAQINYILQAVIRNETYTRTQTDAFQTRYPTITNGDEASEQVELTTRIVRTIIEQGTVLDDVKQLLLDNKEFAKAEVVAFVSASYENLNYNIELCARDVGLIVDAIAYDIYGGLSRSREAGLRYYQSASALLAIGGEDHTGEQYGPTVAAMEFLNDVLLAVLADQDPAVRFQELVPRIAPAAGLVFSANRILIPSRVTTFIDTILEVINDGPSVLPPGRYSARLQLSPTLSISTAPAHDTAMVIRSRYSQVRLTGHDFLNIGTGSKNDTNYPGIPLNAPNANQELSEQGGGRVFYTSTDQDGNFRVGTLFKVEQSTGIATLNADAFNLSGLNELALGGVSLGGTGAVINEFSTDGTFFANSDRIVPTQKAIKTYIQSALGSGGGNIAVNAVTAGDVFITGKEIDTIGGGLLSILSDDGVYIDSILSSTNITSGALTVAGGVGIGENLNVGGNIVVAGALTVSGAGYIKVATGSTAERPGSPSAGMIRYNTSASQFEGYLGTQWAELGGGGRPWTAKTTTYTSVASDRLIVNTAGSAFTINLPATPVVGDTVKFIDGAGTFHINNLTIGRNGSNIMGASEDMVVATENAAFTLVFYNTTYGWRLGDA